MGDSDYDAADDSNTGAKQGKLAKWETLYASSIEVPTTGECNQLPDCLRGRFRSCVMHGSVWVE